MFQSAEGRKEEEEDDPSTTRSCELRGHKWDMHRGRGGGGGGGGGETHDHDVGMKTSLCVSAPGVLTELQLNPI